MDRTRWMIFAGICAVVLGGLVLTSKKDKVNVDNTDPLAIVQASKTSIGDHVYGKADAKVKVIEYADFQCPGCGGAYPRLEVIKNQYKDRVAFIYRNFPLTAIHPNALAAATAAEAAGLQGKFWEMHNKLFENQQGWSTVEAAKRTDTFVAYAKDIGIDATKFKNDLSDPRIAEKISRDRSLGSKQKVDSTPTVFVGADKLSQEETSDIAGKSEKLIKRIEDALKKAQ